MNDDPVSALEDVCEVLAVEPLDFPATCVKVNIANLFKLKFVEKV